MRSRLVPAVSGSLGWSPDHRDVGPVSLVPYKQARWVFGQKDVKRAAARGSSNKMVRGLSYRMGMGMCGS
jgi:hypothetical protein